MLNIFKFIMITLMVISCGRASPQRDLLSGTQSTVTNKKLIGLWQEGCKSKLWGANKGNGQKVFQETYEKRLLLILSDGNYRSTIFSFTSDDCKTLKSATLDWGIATDQEFIKRPILPTNNGSPLRFLEFKSSSHLRLQRLNRGRVNLSSSTKCEEFYANLSYLFDEHVICTANNSVDKDPQLEEFGFFEDSLQLRRSNSDIKKDDRPSCNSETNLQKLMYKFFSADAEAEQRVAHADTWCEEFKSMPERHADGDLINGLKHLPTPIYQIK